MTKCDESSRLWHCVIKYGATTLTPNETQHYDIQHENKLNATLSITTLSIMAVMLSVKNKPIMLNAIMLYVVVMQSVIMLSVVAL